MKLDPCSLSSLSADSDPATMRIREFAAGASRVAGLTGTKEKEREMLALVLVLLLVAVLFGLGFAVKWLFIVAAVMALLWLIGFFARGSEARWYRW
jgi:hypothetical protein